MTWRPMTRIGMIDGGEPAIAPNEPMPNIVRVILASNDDAVGIEAPCAGPARPIGVVDLDEGITG